MMRGKIRQLIKRILYECMQDADLEKWRVVEHILPFVFWAKL
jgi:hypothetical protein